MENLPDDMKIEILLRLPVKSLSCLKCVSKSWLSLISDPDFPKHHFQQSSQHYTHRFPYLVHAEHDYSHLQMRSIDINASLHDDSAAITFDVPSGYNVILASCRGFLLLQHNKKDELLVWNPSTGEHKQIQLPRRYVELHGFCYDESTDDYLIVVASYMNLHLVLGFWVFSVRTNSWDKEFAFSCGATVMAGFLGQHAGSTVNGVIYWLVYFLEGGLGGIIALDIKTKKVRRLVEPELNHNNIDLKLSYLKVFGESLLALIDVGDYKEIKAWVMKEGYTRKSSCWTKLMSIPRCGVGLRRNLSPLCLTKDGQLVTQRGDPYLTLLKWSGERKLEEERTFRSCYAATPLCIETLLSLPHHIVGLV